MRCEDEAHLRHIGVVWVTSKRSGGGPEVTAWVSWREATGSVALVQCYTIQ